MNVKSNPAGRYVSNNGSWIVITEANTWYGTIYEKSIATGIDWEYSYGGKINNNNELIITKGETRRVLPGGAIVDGGNIFGELVGDEIHSGGLVLKKEDDKLVPMLNEKEGFITTESGVRYKFLTTHPDAQQVQNGDVLFGTMIISFNGDVTFDNSSSPDRLLQAGNSYDLNEVLLMMHSGDNVIIEVPADLICKTIGRNQMPSQYIPGEGMVVEYKINLQNIVPKGVIEKEKDEFNDKVEKDRMNESALIAKYIASNNIKISPTLSGLYIIVKKKGNGKVVQTGRTVSIDYVGSLLDGRVFECSIEEVAKQSGIYKSQHKYEPFTYTVGNTKLIKGWEEGVNGQPEGSEIMLVIPSSLAYGAQGAGSAIPPYTPLIFDITIRSVE